MAPYVEFCQYMEPGQQVQTSVGRAGEASQIWHVHNWSSGPILGLGPHARYVYTLTPCSVRPMDQSHALDSACGLTPYHSSSPQPIKVGCHWSNNIPVAELASLTHTLVPHDIRHLNLNKCQREARDVLELFGMFAQSLPPCGSILIGLKHYCNISINNIRHLLIKEEKVSNKYL